MRATYLLIFAATTLSVCGAHANTCVDLFGIRPQLPSVVNQRSLTPFEKMKLALRKVGDRNLALPAIEDSIRGKSDAKASQRPLPVWYRIKNAESAYERTNEMRLELWEAQTSHLPSADRARILEFFKKSDFLDAFYPGFLDFYALSVYFSADRGLAPFNEVDAKPGSLGMDRLASDVFHASASDGRSMAEVFVAMAQDLPGKLRFNQNSRYATNTRLTDFSRVVHEALKTKLNRYGRSSDGRGDKAYSQFLSDWVEEKTALANLKSEHVEKLKEFSEWVGHTGARRQAFETAFSIVAESLYWNALAFSKGRASDVLNHGGFSLDTIIRHARPLIERSIAVLELAPAKPDFVTIESLRSEYNKHDLSPKEFNEQINKTLFESVPKVIETLGNINGAWVHSSLLFIRRAAARLESTVAARDRERIERVLEKQTPQIEAARKVLVKFKRDAMSSQIQLEAARQFAKAQRDAGDDPSADWDYVTQKIDLLEMNLHQSVAASAALAVAVDMIESKERTIELALLNQRLGRSTAKQLNELLDVMSPVFAADEDSALSSLPALAPPMPRDESSLFSLE